jgi:hypothetical protein
MLLLLTSLPSAFAGDFVDVWVTTAVEDTNLRAGPDSYSPSANFVQRGNRVFFEDYETKTSDDISRAQLVLYRADEGFWKGWSSEAAFVLRYTPYLDPAKTKPGVDVRDDGSYVRLIRDLPGEKHNVSLTGYAVDAGRFRLGYSYDLTWGGKEIHSFTTGAAPGARLQWQKKGNYAFLGFKSTVGDYIDPDTLQSNNQAYYGYLGGAGIELAEKVKLELGLGSFQQGQILNVSDVSSQLYGDIIQAGGLSAQVAFRTRGDLAFIESNDLKLYRNSPETAKDTYIGHRQVDGVGLLVQAEADMLRHNLLSATDDDSTVVESARAGDVQTLLVINTTQVAVDLVYKDLPYILFNVPGLTSGVAMDPDMEKTPQLYARGRVEHYFPNAHVTPSLGFGLMRPATYKTASGTFVQYSETEKEQVPEGQEAAAILSGVLGAQIDFSKSVIMLGELLYTVDNNLSDFVSTTDEAGIVTGGERIPSSEEERNAIGFNLMLRARF